VPTSVNIALNAGRKQLLTETYGQDEEKNNRRHCQEITPVAHYAALKLYNFVYWYFSSILIGTC
jgi:hypothetical protein